MFDPVRDKFQDPPRRGVAEAVVAPPPGGAVGLRGAPAGLPARPDAAVAARANEAGDTPRRKPAADHHHHAYKKHYQRPPGGNRLHYSGGGGPAEEVRAVQEHYNTRPKYRTQDRKRSGIYGVRTFNNFIKSILIDRYSRPHDIVLDLACGRGGDLQKWLKAGIDGLIGIDIADVSIENAEERYANLREKVFWVDFCVGDGFAQHVQDIVAPEAFPVDTVSCQFALHYSFGSETTARTALSNIGYALKPGGAFIATIPNSEYLAEHLRSGETEWGNSIFRIEFDKPNPSGEFTQTFGYRYTFYLAEAVEKVPEYVVPRDALEALAGEYGMTLVAYSPFMEFFHTALRDRDVFQAAQNSNIVDYQGNFVIAPEQLAASEAYAAVVFVKK